MSDDIETDASAGLVDAIFNGLPREIGGRPVEADFNDDNTITVRVGGKSYVVSAKED